MPQYGWLPMARPACFPASNVTPSTRGTNGDFAEPLIDRSAVGQRALDVKHPRAGHGKSKSDSVAALAIVTRRLDERRHAGMSHVRFEPERSRWNFFTGAVEDHEFSDRLAIDDG